MTNKFALVAAADHDPDSVSGEPANTDRIMRASVEPQNTRDGEVRAWA